MKYLIYLIVLFFSVPLISCLGSNDEEYTEWRAENDKYMLSKEIETDADGNLKYKKVYASWNPQGYVLMQWHNNRSLTEKNLSPLSTSTVDLKFHGRLITEEPFDSSYLRTSPADSIYRSQLNENIPGFIIGISQMHIGDSCTIIIPYREGYGAAGSRSIKPFSNLIFDVKLVDIPGYQIPSED